MHTALARESVVIFGGSAGQSKTFRDFVSLRFDGKKNLTTSLGSQLILRSIQFNGKRFVLFSTIFLCFCVSNTILCTESGKELEICEVSSSISGFLPSARTGHQCVEFGENVRYFIGGSSGTVQHNTIYVLQSGIFHGCIHRSFAGKNTHVTRGLFQSLA
jgi:hypothetical protein